MSSEQKLLLKQQLIDRCNEIILQKSEVLKNTLTSIKDSKANETKSSVGDKYETGMAMLQAEEARINHQLSKVISLKNDMQQISSEKVFSDFQLGAVAETNQGNYFLSVPLGKITLSDKTFFCISPASPIAKHLQDKSSGDTVRFNGQKIQIISCY